MNTNQDADQLDAGRAAASGLAASERNGAPHAEELTAPLLDVRNVSVRFGNLDAVKNASFALHRGELMGLIGPNGAGKTTLLRAVVGLQEITRGDIHVSGLPVGRPGDPYCARVGFTPDVPMLYTKMTVRNFLRFIGRGYHVSHAETERRIDFWLEKLWLTEKSKQRIATLSRGMRQRVGIARTLLPDPDVILLDEPAGGLDPVGRMHFRDLLIYLRNVGKSLIVSSHILSDLAEYCTHVGIMSRGQLVRFGSVDQVAGAGEGGRCRYGILLAQVDGQPRNVAQQITGVSDVQLARDMLSLEYAAGKQSAAELLSHLIGAGLPVAAFFPELPNLERAYLSSFTNVQPGDQALPSDIVPAEQA